MPGKGSTQQLRPVDLFAARIDMPNAAGPTAGARAVIGSAADLTRGRAGALEDLFLVGDGGAADLHWAETNSDPVPLPSGHHRVRIRARGVRRERE